jgi:short-subunit dehydrogenase
LRADFAETGVGISVLCPGVVRSALGDSERSRPEHLKNESSEPGPAQSTASGSDPLDLAEDVKAAIEADEFFIVTHAEWRGPLHERHEAIERSIKHEADPEMVKAMSMIIKPF